MTMATIPMDPADAEPAAAPAHASTPGEALRYLAASAAALSVDAGLLWVGVQGLGMSPWLAGAIAYGAGLVVVYGLSIRWVFARRALRDARGEFVVFALLGIVGLLLNSVTLHLATGVGIALPFAKAFSAGIGFVANFVSRKVLLFAVPRAQADR